jgi:hypothetical protein
MCKNNCKVCGLYISPPPWGEDGLSPSYEICPCCGVEFGNEDYTEESIRKYRQQWINKGYEWFEPSERPSDWNPNVQLANVLK